MQLTALQKESLDRGEPVDVTVDRTLCVLMRRDVFVRNRRLPYYDSDWTDSEHELAAAKMFDEIDDAQWSSKFISD